MNLSDKVFGLLNDGREIPLPEWQFINGLSGAQIGRHFYYTESKFLENIQDYGKLVVSAQLMAVADKYRDMKGMPVRVNSFNRSRSKQEQLLKDGYKAAQVSPHEYFLAMDVDTDTEHETRLNAAMIREAAKQLGIKVRIGFEQYLKAKQTFIHFDVCPEFFGKEGVWYSKPHPKQWENEITW